MIAAACLGLAGGSFQPAKAAHSHFSVDVWDNERGLPSSSILAVTQTRDGYLWLGTLYGVVRFDGVRFEVFNEGNTPGLNSSRIIKLFEDSQGGFWIGTDTGGIFVGDKSGTYIQENADEGRSCPK